MNLWYLYIPYIFVHICCALVYSAWYEEVPAWYMLAIPVMPLVLRAHATTNVHELKTALDAGRGRWRCKYGTFAGAVRVKIGGAWVAFEGQSSMHIHTDRQGKNYSFIK